MENESVNINSMNNNELPKEIKADNDNSNPLLDIISNIQEKLNSSNQVNTNTASNSTYNNQNVNFSTQNINTNQVSQNNNSFDASKLFEMFNKLNSNNQNTSQNQSASNPFMNLDLNTMMRFGKIISSMNKEDPRKNLLLSLKPFLRNNRQKNVDTYIFVLGILNVLDSFNNEDSDFNGFV